jgi:hypothetical protein
MKYGYYSDDSIPKFSNPNYETNSLGYRTQEFSPLPEGKKNVVVLGCSHTFGEGLHNEEIWISLLEKKLNQKVLRFWNMAQPGASADLVTRILYATEKTIFPKIIIVCWPVNSRREKLGEVPVNLTNAEKELVVENEHTDHNNFLKNFFLVEKFAAYNNCKTFHCFADEVYDVEQMNCYKNKSLKNCWPKWSTIKTNLADRKLTSEPSLAADGKHFGVEHHEEFANLLFEVWRSRLK